MTGVTERAILAKGFYGTPIEQCVGLIDAHRAAMRLRKARNRRSISGA